MPRAGRGFPLVLLALAPAAWGQPIAPADIPPGLRPWEAWVLETIPEASCPKVDGNPLCLWPGRLRLDLTAGSGGHFSQDVYADRALSLPLPGDMDHWPQGVSVDGTPHPVVPKQEAPTVFLKPGPHRIEGRFLWERLPDSLPVPQGVGLLALSLDGVLVELPEREASGLLWLRRSNPKGSTGESLDLKVYRKLKDGIPLLVETTLVLDVSGRSREIETAGALLEGAAPLSVSGDLPARVDGKGRLHAQVRGGTFTLSVVGRLEGPHPLLVAPRVLAPWPEREIWVFEADEALRQVRLTGAPAIDPSRTDLPEDWRSLPAYALAPGTRIELSELQRGQPLPPPDRLALARDLWLDLSGSGFTVRDTFSGEATRTSRFDLSPPGELGRASVDGVDQVVTRSPQGGGAGVEVRHTPLSLVADSRLPRGARMGAVGWSVGVEQLKTTLHLPPGWTVLGSTGVDTLGGAWVSRWNLLSLFFVILVAWGSARLLGPRTGLLALLAIGLSYHENGAPFVPWLALLIFTAVLGAVAEGFLRTLARWGWWVSVVALILALAPFYRDQIRVALFPATGELSMRPAKAADALQGLGYLGARQAAPAAPPLPRSAPAEEAARPSGYAGKPRVERKDKDKVLAETVSVQAASSTNARLEEDVHAVLQTGPGIPNWSWQSYALAWSGPVSPDHPMRLFLLSPRGNLLLTVVRLLALALLLGRFAGRARDIGWKAPPAAAILLLLMMTAPLARAQSKDEGSSYPSPALLEDLRKRLTRPEACEPECVTTASVVLRATQSALSLLAEVHAAARGAWAIPGPVGSWVPAEVQVDGEKSPPIVRSEDGFLRVRVGPGVHRVEVTGPIPRQDTLTLEFKDRPRHGSAEAPGWEVTGLHPDGPADAQVSLTRRLGTTSDSEGRIYPPWLEITRTVTIRASWRVSTTLRRVSPTGSPVSVKVPLLPGESPTKSGLEVRNGEVQVGLGRDEEEQEWESTLKPVPNGAPLSLEAPQGRPWSEVWTVECGVPVACEAKGIPPVSWQGEGGVRALTFRPWPGEKVALFAGRPEGAPGQTLTVDSLEIADEPGARLESVVLKAQVRASRDGALDLQLPARADVQEVKVGDQPQASRPQGGRLHLTIGRGSQPVLVRWHEDRGMAFAYSAPRVGVDGGATNVTTTVAVPENRWLLFVSGPAWGPAVLFWGYLLLASIVAYLLGRIPGSPLSSLEWWLLSLGLTQTSGTLAALVVGFFFVLAWRGRNRIADPLRHNLLEILLVVWALVALAGLESAVEAGLLLRPEMQVAGGGSTGTLLRWYTDRIVDVSPGERLVSLPLWVYRLVMFAWSFWLVVSLVRWVAWGWRCATEGGAWRLPFLGRRPKSPGTP